MAWILRISSLYSNSNRDEKNKRKQFGIIHHEASEETMGNMQKCLVVSGVVAVGVVGILLMVKAAQHRNHTGMYEKVGKGIDERLKESKETLDKATAHVQNVFEHIKNRKS
jgi:hypothetical protein